MKKQYFAFIALFCSVIAFGALPEVPTQWHDDKYCGPPKRDAEGRIVRSTTAIKYFKQQNPCPITGLTTGSCSGYVNGVWEVYEIDHVRPLARCGCDHPTNMQWLKTTIKRCDGTDCKDRWELKAYSC